MNWTQIFGGDMFANDGAHCLLTMRNLCTNPAQSVIKPSHLISLGKAGHSDIIKFLIDSQLTQRSSVKFGPSIS